MAQVLINTLVQGSLLSLLALGITLVFSVSRFANIMQVEFATLGAYGTVLASSLVGGSLLLDATVSILAVAIVAVGLYGLVFVRLLRRSTVSAMIGSFALSVAIRAAIQTISGPNPTMLNLPIERGVSVLGVRLAPTEIRMVLVGMVAAFAVLALLRLTALGRSMRGVGADPGLVAASGVSPERVVALVWLLAGALGALAGVILAVETQVSLQMGINLLLPVFAAAVIGGFGSPAGAVIAGYGLALLENAVLQVNIAGWQLPVDWEPAIGFTALIVVLIVRPHGLIGGRGRHV